MSPLTPDLLLRRFIFLWSGNKTELLVGLLYVVHSWLWCRFFDLYTLRWLCCRHQTPKLAFIFECGLSCSGKAHHLSLKMWCVVFQLWFCDRVWTRAAPAGRQASVDWVSCWLRLRSSVAFKATDYFSLEKISLSSIYNGQNICDELRCIISCWSSARKSVQILSLYLGGGVKPIRAFVAANKFDESDRLKQSQWKRRVHCVDCSKHWFRCVRRLSIE